MLLRIAVQNYELESYPKRSNTHIKQQPTHNPKLNQLATNLQEQFLDAQPLEEMELLNPMGENAHARFLAFRSDKAPALHAALESYSVVTDVRGDVLRIGFAIYHDKGDVDHLIKIIREVQS